MTQPRVAPWSPDYKSDSNPVPPGVDVPAIIGDVVKDVQSGNPGQAVTDVTNDVTAAAGAVVAQGSVTIPNVVSPTIGSAIDEALAAAKAAAEAQAEKEVEAKVIAALNGSVPQAPAAPTLEPQDVTNAAARGRALRSLVYGVMLTVFWAIVSAVTTAVSTGGVDFFSKTGWIQVGTLAIGTVAHALLSYVGRIKFSPNTPE